MTNSYPGALSTHPMLHCCICAAKQTKQNNAKQDDVRQSTTFTAIVAFTEVPFLPTLPSPPLTWVPQHTRHDQLLPRCLVYPSHASLLHLHSKTNKTKQSKSLHVLAMGNAHHKRRHSWLGFGSLPATDCPSTAASARRSFEPGHRCGPATRVVLAVRAPRRGRSSWCYVSQRPRLRETLLRMRTLRQLSSGTSQRGIGRDPTSP